MIIPIHQLSLLVLLFFDVRILLFALADERYEKDKEKIEKGHTLFDIRYCIMQSHLLHALMLLIPMALLALGLDGHVEISVPAISLYLLHPS